MVVAVLLVVIGAVLIACVQHARSRGWKDLGRRAPRARRLSTTPADDLPPPGLTPLIPSPRVIASEFERGLRELTLYLAVQTGE